MRKFWLTGVLLVLLFMLPQNIAFAAKAAKTGTIEAHFNLISIKVDGKLVKSNTILYNGTTYVPIRNITEMTADLPLTYYPEQKMINIGFVPAGGKEPGQSSDYASSTENDIIEKQEKKRVTVAFDTVTIMVNMEEVKSSNIVYKGRTYIPLRAVSELLDLDVYYHQPTATAYIGTIPEGELTKTSTPAKPSPSTNQGNKSGMYSEAATGNMQGWMLLKGHPYQDAVEIYYSQNGSILTVNVKDIRKVDLNKKVSWVNDKGQTQTNTVGEIYQIFGAFSGQYTSDWFLEKFGDLYTDWLLTSSINAEQLVEQYLNETGQTKNSSSNVTLTPDFKVKTPKGLVKENGATLLYAYDKYGQSKGVFSDNDDSALVISRISKFEELPPKLSEGWIGLDLLEKIYEGEAIYDGQDLVLKTSPMKTKQEEYLRLTLPDNYKNRSVKEFTANKIRIKKFNMDQAKENFGTWINNRELENQTGIYYYFTGNNNEFAFRGTVGGESKKLLTINLPQKWAHVPDQKETVIDGLRMKREDNIDYFYVEDLRKLNVITTDEESSNYKLYLNISDLQKAGILQ